MTKVIVAGPRDFYDEEFVYKNLDYVLDLIKERTKDDDIEIVQGGAKGVDALAKKYAIEHGIKQKEFPADWNKHGKAAGPIRNNQMAQYADVLVAFQSEGFTKGTLNMIKVSKGKCSMRFIITKEKGLTQIIV